VLWKYGVDDRLLLATTSLYCCSNVREVNSSVTVGSWRNQPSALHGQFGAALRLPDVLERQELSLNLLSKLVMSLILEKGLALEYLPASLKILESHQNSEAGFCAV